MLTVEITHPVVSITHKRSRWGPGKAWSYIACRRRERFGNKYASNDWNDVDCSCCQFLNPEAVATRRAKCARTARDWLDDDG